jgi:LysR family transcriptional regulator, regulator for bpeEF and oprC
VVYQSHVALICCTDHLHGIAYAPAWRFEDALADQRVRSLLIEHHGPPVPIQFVYAANRLLPRRARVFMDFIAEAFARDPALNSDAGRQVD